MRLPMKPAVIASDVAWKFEKLYSIGNTATGQATTLLKQEILPDGTLTGLSMPYGSYMGANAFEDDYIKLGYGIVTSLYWSMILKKDAKVNGVDQVAGYTVSWGYTAAQSLFIEFD